MNITEIKQAIADELKRITEKYNKKDSKYLTKSEAIKSITKMILSKKMIPIEEAPAEGIEGMTVFATNVVKILIFPKEIYRNIVDILNEDSITEDILKIYIDSIIVHEQTHVEQYHRGILEIAFDSNNLDVESKERYLNHPLEIEAYQNQLKYLINII